MGALVEAAFSAVSHNDPNIEYYYFEFNLCVKSHPNVLLKTARGSAAIVGVFYMWWRVRKTHFYPH